MAAPRDVRQTRLYGPAHSASWGRASDVRKKPAPAAWHLPCNRPYAETTQTTLEGASV